MASANAPNGKPFPERVLRTVDGWQQRSRVAGPAFGVVRKFGDDRGPSLAALLAYYGFLSLFPLLLVLTTVLGFVGNTRLKQTVLGSTLQQFPVVGQQIGRSAAHPLHGSGIGLAFGLITLLYGSLGVTQVAQRTMADVWNVPNVVRPGFVPRLGRSLLFLMALVVGLGASALTSGLVTAASSGILTRITLGVCSLLLDVALLAVLFRILTPKEIPSRQLWIGAVAAGAGYMVLLTIGTGLVQHQLRNAQALYGQFGFVLGLIGWMYLVAQVTIYAAEANVVIERHLWPRSLLQPPLTEADQAVLGAIARQEERRPEQSVEVEFDQAPPTDGEPH